MVNQSTGTTKSDRENHQKPVDYGPVALSLFRQRWLAILIIMTGLVVWGGIHAWGAYDSRGGELGVLKALFVLLSMALFLSSWAALLWLRHRRIRHVTPATRPSDRDE